MREETTPNRCARGVPELERLHSCRRVSGWGGKSAALPVHGQPPIRFEAHWDHEPTLVLPRTRTIARFMEREHPQKIDVSWGHELVSAGYGFSLRSTEVTAAQQRRPTNLVGRTCRSAVASRQPVKRC